MAFIKEDIAEKDRELYNSFKIYDYDHNDLSRWGPDKIWLVDRERKIYFTYISGGALEHPKQYTLVCNGYKIVVFLHSYVSVIKDKDGKELYMEPHWNIFKILAPLKLRDKSKEIIELIKEVSIANNSEYFKIDHIPSVPSWLEEVK
jgi:hypothetical protein